jgi:hypothetical protein
MDDEKYDKLVTALTEQCEDSIALIKIVDGLVKMMGDMIEREQEQLRCLTTVDARLNRLEVYQNIIPFASEKL